MATLFNHETIQKRMDYLAGRWADESQYEDFDKDYAACIRDTITAAGATFVSLTKRPFACVYTTPGVTWTCKVGKTRITVVGVKA